MAQIGMNERPKVIDLTQKSGTAGALTEARIHCSKSDEKDLYVYYFLLRYPGRTIVFANSKDCIRRLVSIFTLLQCQPLPLHADMHQRQRLRNLDKFKGLWSLSAEHWLSLCFHIECCQGYCFYIFDDVFQL